MKFVFFIGFFWFVFRFFVIVYVVVRVFCSFRGRYVLVGFVVLRRYGRGVCAALEGVRAYVGVARGGDRGRGGGGRSFSRLVVRDV